MSDEAAGSSELNRDLEELIERVVLGTASEAERSEVRSRSETDPAFRAAVERELKLAAGLRKAGREMLRGRLHAALGEKSGAVAVPWQRIFGIAAVILVLVGVGIVNDWFLVKRQTAPTGEDRLAQGPLRESEDPVEARKDNPEPGTDETASRRSASTPPAAASAPKTADPTGEGTHPGQPATKTEESVLADHRISDATSTTNPSMPSPAVEADMQNEEPSKIGLNAAGAGESDRALWVVGRVLSYDPTGDKQTLERLETDAQEDRQQLQQRLLKGQGKRGQRGPVLLSQRETTTRDDKEFSVPVLPRGGIPTRIMRSDGVLHLELHPPRPLHELDLQMATIETVGEDSLTVIIGGLVLGYRIPGGITGRPTLTPAR